MARRTSRSKKKTGVSVDFSNVGKQFEAEQEYGVEVAVCTLEEGNEHPYFAIQFKGIEEDYEDSIMYHNASTSPQSLWRLRPLVEALGIEIPDGAMDLNADDFVGKRCMCSTILEKREGGKTAIRPDEFWPLDEDDAPKKGKAGKKSKDEAEMPDLDAFSDDDIKALAKELGVKGRKVDQLKEDIGELDADDVVGAIEELGLEPEEAEEPKGRKGKKDEDDDAPKGRRSRKAKDEDEEEDEPKGKAGRSSRGSKKSKKKSDVTEDDINDMSEDELNDVVEEHELDVDLDDHRTLRKKKAAVIDALQEAGVLE